MDIQKAAIKRLVAKTALKGLSGESLLEYIIGKSMDTTSKPVALMEYLIRTYTNEGDTVLDFCMGSGSTGVACVRSGRKFIGIEKNEAYFNIAKERIENTQRPLI